MSHFELRCMLSVAWIISWTALELTAVCWGTKLVFSIFLFFDRNKPIIFRKLRYTIHVKYASQPEPPRNVSNGRGPVQLRGLRTITNRQNKHSKSKSPYTSVTTPTRIWNSKYPRDASQPAPTTSRRPSLSRSFLNIQACRARGIPSGEQILAGCRAPRARR